jgi:hypothetical protein
MITQSPSRIAIVVASTGRPAELGRWIYHVQRQTVQPIKLVYAVVKETDLPAWEEAPANLTVLFCASGLPVQRNAALDAVSSSCDIIAFFDDDYVPSSYCIEGIDAFFKAHPDVVGANGTLLADGINSSGISYEEAEDLVVQHDGLPRIEASIVGDLNGLYGCNMVFRVSAIGKERFDEALPSYAWQEDIDFAARVGRRGRLVKTNAFYGVHQGVKGARLAGTRLGYSQVANPIYLVRKGTVPVSYAAKLILKNVVKNHAKSLSPEPWIDRRGRCRGNWFAIFDVLFGRDHPQNILNLPQ